MFIETVLIQYRALLGAESAAPNGAQNLKRVVGFYKHLVPLEPKPGVAPNRTVAIKPTVSLYHCSDDGDRRY
jgi:hypothetical protein